MNWARMLATHNSVIPARPSGTTPESKAPQSIQAWLTHKLTDWSRATEYWEEIYPGLTSAGMETSSARRMATTFSMLMREPVNLPEGRLCAETSHKKTSGQPRIWRHYFRCARDSGEIANL